MGDGIRLAVGTLTVLPCPPPRTVDRRAGATAMTLAPLVGLLLWAVAMVPLWLMGHLLPRPTSPLVAATVVVGLLALLTRAIHLDGLADTADGLGSGRPPEGALEVMRKGDIGPFGVVALVLVLLLQVAALADLVGRGQGAFSLALALVVSRLTLPFLCATRVPAARPDGLGRTVAGTVGAGRLVLATALAATALVALGWVGHSVAPSTMRLTPMAGPASLSGLLVGGAAAWWCVRRLGGITGDVLGTCVELTATTVLVVLTMG